MLRLYKNHIQIPWFCLANAGRFHYDHIHRIIEIKNNDDVKRCKDAIQNNDVKHDKHVETQQCCVSTDMFYSDDDYLYRKHTTWYNIKIPANHDRII